MQAPRLSDSLVMPACPASFFSRKGGSGLPSVAGMTAKRRVAGMTAMRGGRRKDG
jgi:hypothetical protein